jgi:cytochrome c oxidase accessory protein FixG
MATLGKYEYTNSLRADGSRKLIYPADVHGRYQRLKKYIHPVMMLIFFALPLIRLGDERLLLLDIQRRSFYIFGLTFNAQDIYLIFFLVSGLAFTLFFITALVGRIFCGWACPQTVFLEGLYRRVERWIEGPHTTFYKNQASKNATHYRRLVAKYIAYLAISFVLAHTVVLYFVELSVYRDIWLGLAPHPVVLTWLIALTLLLTFNYGWFREQLCVIICPYGRIQSALTDDDTLVIGYDPERGEPRGKAKDVNRGACIDCNRCVAVCPTGIDIRNGLQMECIGCANCIDACNEIMVKTGQPQGLIRYDSYNGLHHLKKKILRPRIAAYTLLLVIGMAVFAFTVSKRQPFEANLLRFQGAPYTLKQDQISNQFEIHLFNKDRTPKTFVIEPQPTADVRFTLPIQTITLDKLKDQRIPVFVDMPKAKYSAPFDLTFTITQVETGKTIRTQAKFLGP